MSANSFKLAYVCPVDWNSMSGDDAKRYCAQCKLHVVNLSDMERGEAEKLIRDKTNERLCINYLVGENQQPLFRSDWLRIAATATLAGSMALSSVAAENPSVKPDDQQVSPAPEVRLGGSVAMNPDREVEEARKKSEAEKAMRVQRLGGKPVAPTCRHVVLEAETLWSIAKQHKTSVAGLKELNGLKNDVIRPGQVLKLPKK